MKLNTQELAAVAVAHQAPAPAVMPHTFQLPALHTDIPTQVIRIVPDKATDRLVRSLVAIGVINLSEIPDSVESAYEVLNTGLGSWFNKRTKNIAALRFSIELNDDATTRNFSAHYAEYLAYYQSGKPKTLKGFSLSFDSDEPQAMAMRGITDPLNESHPGLVETALVALQNVSNTQLTIKTPRESFERIAESYWEACTRTVMTDKFARKRLVNIFGDDGGEDYLPSKIVEVFGGINYLPRYSTKTRKANRLIPIARLKKIAQANNDVLATSVAKKVLELQRLIKIAAKHKASLPDLYGTGATGTGSSCRLMYSEHNNPMWQEIDEEIDHGYQSGEGTETLGIKQLPTKRDQLKLFFDHLDIALRVVTAADELIQLISKPVKRP